MFESIIADILSSQLGNFLEGLSSEQLNLSIWKGDVSLRNLVVRENALSFLDLPIRVSRGHLNHLHMQVPWSDLKGQPCKIVLDGLTFVAVPDVHGDKSKTEKEVQIWNEKKAQIVAAEAVREQKKKLSASTGAESDGYMTRLLTRIVNNLQVEIKNIHIRYENDVTCPGTRFAVGLRLESMALRSCNESWQETFVLEDSDVVIYKLLRVQNFSMYCEECPENDNLERSDHKYIVEPVSLGVKAAVNKSPVPHKMGLPIVDVSLEIAKVHWNLFQQQYDIMMHAAASLATDATGPLLRRVISLPAPRTPAERWTYAIENILSLLAWKRRQIRWVPIKTRRSLRLIYTKEYKRVVLDTKTKGDLYEKSRTLKVLELRLAIQDIMFYRTIVDRQITEAEIARKKKDGGAKQAESRGWLGYFGWSGGGGAEKQHADKADLQAQQKALEEIFDESVAWDISNDQLPPDYVKFAVSLNLGGADVSLHLKEDPVLMLGCSSVRTTVAVCPTTIRVNAACGDLLGRALCAKNYLFRDIVRRSGSPDSGDLLEVTVERQAIEKEPVHMRVAAKLLPVRIIYDQRCIEETQKVFQTSVPQSETQQTWVEAQEGLATYQTAALAGLYESMEDPPSMEINCSLAGPTIVVHGKDETDAAPLLTMNCGNLSIRSMPPMDPSDYIYQRILLETTGVGATMHTIAAFRGKKTATQPLRLLHPLDLKVNVAVKNSISIRPEKPQLCLDGELPAVYLEITQDALLSLTEITASLVPAEPVAASVASVPAPVARPAALPSSTDLAAALTADDRRDESQGIASEMRFTLRTLHVAVSSTPEEPLINITIDDLHAGIVSGDDRSMAVTAHMHDFRIQDLQQTAKSPCLYLARLAATEVGAHGLTLSYKADSPRLPDGRGVDAIVELISVPLIVNVNRPAVMSLMDFASSLAVAAAPSDVCPENVSLPESSGLSGSRGGGTAQDTGLHLPDVGVVESKSLVDATSRLEVSVTLGGMVAHLNDPTSLLDFHLGSIAAKYTQEQDGAVMYASGHMGDLSIIDPRCAGPYKNILSIDGDRVLQFDFAGGEKNEKSVRKIMDTHGIREGETFASFLYLKLASIRGYVVGSFLRNVMHFVEPFSQQAAAAAVPTGEQLPAASNQGGSFGFKIDIDNPVVVIPESDTSSDVVVCDLGKISVATSRWVSEKWADVRNVIMLDLAAFRIHAGSLLPGKKTHGTLKSGDKSGLHFWRLHENTSLVTMLDDVSCQVHVASWEQRERFLMPLSTARSSDLPSLQGQQRITVAFRRISGSFSDAQVASLLRMVNGNLAALWTADSTGAPGAPGDSGSGTQAAAVTPSHSGAIVQGKTSAPRDIGLIVCAVICVNVPEISLIAQSAKESRSLFHICLSNLTFNSASFEAPLGTPSEDHHLSARSCLALNHISVQRLDDGKGGTKFRQMIYPTKSGAGAAGADPEILITLKNHIGGPHSTKVLVECFCFVITPSAVRYLMTFVDAITSAVPEQGTKPKSLSTESSTSTAVPSSPAPVPVESSVTDICVMAPQIHIIADDQQEVSHSIRIGGESLDINFVQGRNAQESSAILRLSGLSATIAAVRSQDDRGVLDVSGTRTMLSPFSATVRYVTGAKHVPFNNVSIDLTPVHLKLRSRDIQRLQLTAMKLAAAATVSRASPPALPAPSSTSVPNTTPQSQPQANESLVVNLPNASVVLMHSEKGVSTPLLHFSLDNPDIAASNWSSPDMAASLKCGLTFQVFNAAATTWEPILEPWSWSLSVSRTPIAGEGSTGVSTSVNFMADSRMEINFSATLLDSLDLATGLFAVDDTSDDADAAIENVACVNVVNETGLDLRGYLEVAPLYGVDEGSTEDQRASFEVPATLDAVASPVPVTVPDTVLIKSARIVLQHPTAGKETIQMKLPLQLAQSHPALLQFRSDLGIEFPARTLAIDMPVLQGVKTLCLRSHVAVENLLDVSMCVSIRCGTQAPWTVCLAPGATRGVPIQHTRGAVSIRPMVDGPGGAEGSYSYQWRQPRVMATEDWDQANFQSDADLISFVTAYSGGKQVSSAERVHVTVITTSEDPAAGQKSKRGSGLSTLRKMTLLPPVWLMNTLPMPMQVKLNQPTSGEEVTVSLSPGEEKAVTGLEHHPGAKLHASVSVPGFGWSETVKVKPSGDKVCEDTVTVPHKNSSGTQVGCDVAVKVTSAHMKHSRSGCFGPCKIAFSCAYMVENRTAMRVAVAAAASQDATKGTLLLWEPPNGGSRNKDDVSYTLVPLNEVTKKKFVCVRSLLERDDPLVATGSHATGGKVTVGGAGSMEFSAPIAADAVGLSDTLTLQASGRILEAAYEVTLVTHTSQSERSKQMELAFPDPIEPPLTSHCLRLKPRYLFVNCTNHTISMREAGSNTPGVQIPVGDSCSYLWQTPQSRSVQIQFVSGSATWSWSTALDVGVEGDFSVGLRSSEVSADKACSYYIARVSIRQNPDARAAIVVSFREEDPESPPYRITNHTSQLISLHQADSPSAPRFDIEPGTTLGYTWSEIKAEKAERILELGCNGRTYRFQPDFVGPFELPSTSPSGPPLYGYVKGEPNTQAITFCPSSAASVSALAAVERNDSLNLTIDLEGLGLSVLDRRPEELLYAVISDISLDVRTCPERISCSARFRDIQIDNTLRQTSTPILLSLQTEQYDSLASDVALAGQKDAFRFKTVKKTTALDLNHHFETFGVEILRNAIVAVDEELISRLIHLFTGPDKPRDTQKQHHHHHHQKHQKPVAPEPAAAQRMVFDAFLINPISLRVMFTKGRSEKSDEGKEVAVTRGIPLLSAVTGAFGVSMSSIDITLKLDALLLEQLDTTNDVLVSKITSHYTMQVLRQFYLMVGGLNILGNPQELFRSVATGVRALFYEPAKGLSQGPVEFAAGVTKGAKTLVSSTVYGFSSTAGTVTGTLSKGIASLSMDDEYQARRDRQSRKRQLEHTSVPGAALRGIKDLKNSMVDGFGGVLTKPMEGAKKDGVRGFGKGLMQGVFGAVTKPTIGVLDFATSTAEGIRNAAATAGGASLQTRAKSRIRPPRVTGAGLPISAYDMSAAKGQLVLDALSGGQYAEERCIGTVRLDGKDAIVTADLIILHAKKDVTVYNLEDVVTCANSGSDVLLRLNMHEANRVARSLSLPCGSPEAAEILSKLITDARALSDPAWQPAAAPSTKKLAQNKNLARNQPVSSNIEAFCSDLWRCGAVNATDGTKMSEGHRCFRGWLPASDRTSSREGELVVHLPGRCSVSRVEILWCTDCVAPPSYYSVSAAVAAGSTPAFQRYAPGTCAWKEVCSSQSRAEPRVAVDLPDPLANVFAVRVAVVAPAEAETRLGGKVPDSKFQVAIQQVRVYGCACEPVPVSCQSVSEA